MRRGIRYVPVVIAGLLVFGAAWVFEGDLPAAQVDTRYTNAASQFLTLPNGVRVHYRDEGQPDGPPVVLVHGSNASLHTWEPWVARLGDTWRIVTLDLPGHGLTGRVPGDDYSMGAYVATVRALADHLGIREFVLGGNSMGGGVAWRFALAHPERVSAMILVDAVGPWAWRDQVGPPGAQESPLAFGLLRQAWFRGIARYIDPEMLIRWGLRASFHDPAKVDDLMVGRYYAMAMREGSRAATLIRFGNLRAEAAERKPDLSALAQPTLVLWGEHDRLIPVAVGQRLATVLPNAKLIVYPDAGHIPMEEIPDPTAGDVRAFLGSLPMSRAVVESTRARAGAAPWLKRRPGAFARRGGACSHVGG
jgi:pimeloyl-ACP methyl ester carboxylesterase